jgi:hypothetical protein
MKRKYQEKFSELEEFALSALCDKIRSKGGNDLAALAILDLARHAGLSIADLEKQKGAFPAFADAVWSDVAAKFHLEPSRDFYQLDIFSVPDACVPPSFHRELMRASAQWLDVYQERCS